MKWLLGGFVLWTVLRNRFGKYADLVSPERAKVTIKSDEDE